MDTNRYEITPEQDAALKDKVQWTQAGERAVADIVVHGVSLNLSYRPPILDVTITHKPWYIPTSAVWSALDEYIYTQGKTTFND